MRTARFVSLNQYVPTGPVKPDHFTVATRDVRDPREGEVVLRPLVFSLDPTVRGRLTGTDDFVRLGEPITGAAVAEVLESRNPAVRSGDIVTGLAIEWAEVSIWPTADKRHADELTQVPQGVEKPSHAVGVFGIMGGLTAYLGMVGAGQVQAGETVVVSAAAGSVGSVAGQIAKLRGATVIGLAGSEEKRRVLTERLGFAAALDYRAPDLAEQITRHAPHGPDLYYDNVGGPVSQTVMGLMRHPARVVECGQIATLDDSAPLTIDTRPIIMNGLTLRGFTPLHYADMVPTALDELMRWVKCGELIPLETERRGLDALPVAFSGMLRGENIGKMVVTIP